MEYRAKMARYAGGARETAAVVAAMGEYYKPYTIFNLGLQHKFNDNWQINFAINNLFDKDFDKTQVVNGIEYNYYCSTGRGGTGSYIGGRSYWVGVTYNF
jgi:outer membrane receptor for ferrienterochelin and colicins